MSEQTRGCDEQVVDRAVARLIDAGAHVIDLTDLYALGVSSTVAPLDLLQSIERVGASRSVEMAGLATCGGRRFAIERVDPATADFTTRFDDAIRRRLQARATSLGATSIPERYYGTRTERHAMADHFDRAIYAHCQALGCRVAMVLEMIPPIYRIAYGQPTPRARRTPESPTDNDGDHGMDVCGD
ncbi:Casein kinase ii domain-containing protein [Pandoravirus kuranda]|uniref:Casein kinase ii domain-containing protein n=1 Tax=Pandoravirus kuranda TaxID=3019033 RepID=A0AA95ECY6_9VIRU|nr:Casein kinase ii domain-containing protein [Pandoravirus kuranda]